MILDTIALLGRYRSIHPLLGRGLDFVARGRLGDLPDGRHELEGDRLFVLLQTYRTKPLAQGKLETHRRYLDIQVVLRGSERFGYAPLAQTTPDLAYDPERDIAFHRGRADLVTLEPGLFAVLFPNDAHMPGLDLLEGAMEVRKAVLKVAVE
jgi:YhcH/YjgK/YiaL family protein